MEFVIVICLFIFVFCIIKLIQYGPAAFKKSLQDKTDYKIHVDALEVVDGNVRLKDDVIKYEECQTCGNKKKRHGETCEYCE